MREDIAMISLRFNAACNTPYVRSKKKLKLILRAEFEKITVRLCESEPLQGIKEHRLDGQGGPHRGMTIALR